MRSRLTTIVLVLALVTGLSLLLYPTVSNWWNSFHQSGAIAAYTEQVEATDDATRAQMLADAQAYNASLASEDDARYDPTPDEHATYESLLNMAGNGIMGFIDIPSISCRLPIYHGVDPAVLEVAVGHIEGTSLPVGGAGTHAVLSGHRGLPSAKLFTDLDKLSEGDLFYLNVLGQTLVYEVDQIRIVLPDEMDDLEIEPGKDLCTLTTCTPYGLNTHRLLVRGHRVEDTSEALARVTADADQVDPILAASVLAVPMMLVLLVAALLPKRGKRGAKAPAQTDEGRDLHDNE